MGRKDKYVLYQRLLNHEDPNVRKATANAASREFVAGHTWQDCSDDDSFVDSSDDDEDQLMEGAGYGAYEDPFEKLAMKFQGLGDDLALLRDDGDDDSGEIETPVKHDVEVVTYEGTTFGKNRCYSIQTASKSGTDNRIRVGIKHFVSQDRAVFVLIVPFEQTFVGDLNKTIRPDEAVEAPPTGMNLLQIPTVVREIHLKNFSNRSFEELGELPEWAFEPTKGMNFAYYSHTPKERLGKRDGMVNCADLFSGAGGMSAGLIKNGFRIKVGVEMNKDAARAFLANHGGRKDLSSSEIVFESCRDNPEYIADRLASGGTCVFNGTVDEFLKKWEGCPDFRKAFGNVHYIVLSPPCQGFSAENSNGGFDDEKNRAESLRVLKVAKLIRPLALSFENVTGMWRKKHMADYLFPIYFGLLKEGYQFRQCRLQACDYGDPQTRQRLFIFATLPVVPLPNVPAKTHGPPDCQAVLTNKLYPYVTAKEALDKLSLNVKESDKKPLESDGKYYLTADKPAPALRASKLPLHYRENRYIVHQEAHALTFDPSFQTEGSDREKARQAGNAISMEQATAVGREFMLCLKHKYAGEES